MGLDESRQYLNGIYLHSNGETVSTVATDLRLSKCSLPEPIKQSFDGIQSRKKLF